MTGKTAAYGGRAKVKAQGVEDPAWQRADVGLSDYSRPRDVDNPPLSAGGTHDAMQTTLASSVESPVRTWSCPSWCTPTVTKVGTPE